MTYELNLNEENQLILNIYLPNNLNNIYLKLIDHTKNESEITDYTLTDNQITYIIPSNLYKIEGNFKYYVIADDYQSEYIEINSHICDAKNKCQKIEITSGEFCICIKSHGNNLNNYLKEEQIVGTWVDEKPIYRKEVEGITGANGVNVELASNVDKLINYNIVVGRDGGYQSHPINNGMVLNSEEHVSPIWVNDTKNIINLYITSQPYCEQPYYGWIEYTKTTD